MKSELIDNYGRIAKKLRISVTDRCNMRCGYCMPKDNTKWFDTTEVLSFDEIIRLSSIFANLGVEKIRLTGGEPLVRPSIENLIKSIAKIGNIKSIGLTTNGLLLQEKVEALKSSGLDSVNISLDSFKEDRFKMMTGVNGLEKVVNSIQKAKDVGFDVKINTVVVRGWNDDEVVEFANFARRTGITVRFIEFMPLDGSGIWRNDLVFSKMEMMEKLESNIGKVFPASDQEMSAPAKLYSFSDRIGTVGFIPSVTEPFCSQCDRIRLTSDGRFLTCLFESPGYDIKSYLRKGASDEELSHRLVRCVAMKQEGIESLIRINGLKPKLNLMHTIGG
ncbi:MAG: GTP 3',8-cyclase MoaA [Nitrososphaeraceae archaeon]|nr:GTP 3',8-cyclase MoaA [Nitrososphaeraceae archaeon]MDW0187632.1 GTP 3',8-cyclase MoaA [Nitrososphaeraceae archaeon]MDW0253472.1 GTP 3',8-cyclase MoaA [Nitrososphaeraceae archaeon]MDW0273765.1 GTP 3',8-cyclase MoaA [Nitrososphaeraceae archaeon]MDW0280417.1 GTP 3',8-cyclase MoaA [Nitrososphaeraceae archaeon]